MAMTWECQICQNPRLDDCCTDETYMDEESCPGVGYPTSSMAITSASSEVAVEFERLDSADGLQCTKHVVCCTAMTWECQICQNPRLDDCCTDETYMDEESCPGVGYPTSSMAITTIASEATVEFERMDGMQCAKHEVVFVPIYEELKGVGRCETPTKISGKLTKDQCAIKSYDEHATHFDWHKEKCRLCQGDSAKPGKRKVFQLTR